jgi:hypothetical protein
LIPGFTGEAKPEGSCAEARFAENPPNPHLPKLSSSQTLDFPAFSLARRLPFPGADRTTAPIPERRTT